MNIAMGYVSHFLCHSRITEGRVNSFLNFINLTFLGFVLAPLDEICRVVRWVLTNFWSVSIWCIWGNKTNLLSYRKYIILL